MLQSLVEYEEAEGEVLTREEKKEQKEKFLSRYYEKVMRLFEEVSAPQYVILVAQEATRILRSNDERSVSMYREAEMGSEEQRRRGDGWWLVCSEFHAGFLGLGEERTIEWVWLLLSGCSCY